MKVRLLCDRSGQGFYQPAGEVVDLPPADARRLLDAGHAEPVTDEPKSRKAKGDKP